jgi:hypothetical protein
MNVEIGTEAALFLEKEYINGIAFAVHVHRKRGRVSFNVLFKRQPKIVKTTNAYTKSTVLIFRTLKENIHLVTLSLSRSCK